VSLEEMKRGFESEAHLSLSDDEARALFAAFDTDGSGSVDLREMLTKFKALDRDSRGGGQFGRDTGRARAVARGDAHSVLPTGKVPWNKSTFLGDWGIVGNGQSSRPGSSSGAVGGGLAVPALLFALQQKERAATPWSRNSRRHNARLAASSCGSRAHKNGKPAYRTPAQRQTDACAAMRSEKRRRAEIWKKRTDPSYDERAARWPGNATHAPFFTVPDSAPAGWYEKLKHAAGATSAGNLTSRGTGETKSGHGNRPNLPPRAASAGRTRCGGGASRGGRSGPSVVYKGLRPPLY